MRWLHFVFALSTSSRGIDYASEIVAFPRGASLCWGKVPNIRQETKPCFPQAPLLPAKPLSSFSPPTRLPAMPNYSHFDRLSPVSSDDGDERSVSRTVATSTLESAAAEFSESDANNDRLTLQPPTPSSTFPSPPPSTASTSSATSSPRSGPQSLVPNDPFARIYAQIEEHNRATLLNFDSERFCPSDLLLTIKVDSDTAFKFIRNYQKVPDRHWLHKVEYYDHQLQIASTRMGGARAYHDVAPTALREHLLKFWYIEHRIPFTLYKKANVDVQCMSILPRSVKATD